MIKVKITTKTALFIVIIAILLSANFSCRKMDIQAPVTVENISPSRSNDISRRFFNTHSPSDVNVIAIRNNILRQEQKTPFIDKFVSYAGYPVWDKAVLRSATRAGIGQREVTEKVILIPLAKDSIIKAILKVTISGSDTTFQTIYRWQYNQNGYRQKGAINSANETALLFMGMESYAFGHNNFKINDTLLLNGKEKRRMSDTLRITSFGHTAIQNRVDIITITICYDVRVVDEPPARKLIESRSASVPCHCHIEQVCNNYYSFVESGGGTAGGGGTTAPPPAGGGGGSGGGGSWNDDPCAPQRPERVAFKAAPPCDGSVEDPLVPIQPIEDDPITVNLNDLLNLDNNQALWLANHPDYISTIYNELQLDNFSDEAKVTAKIIIDQGANSLLDTDWGESFGNVAYPHVKSLYDQCCPGLLQPLNPSVWGIKWANETKLAYVTNKLEHPNWSKWKCLWEASKESVHTALDGAGLIPVIGEVFDLTNGILYTIEGDGLNATLSYASMLPIAGWAANSVKCARRIDKLNYFVTSASKIVSFGSYNSAKFRKALGIAVGDATKQAHHVVPRADIIVKHEVVQRATQAATNQGFHIDNVLNGIPVDTWRNQPNHNLYTQRIWEKLEDFYSKNPNATPESCYNKLLGVINDVKTAITNNPNIHLNNLDF